MPINVTCPECEFHFRVGDEFAGRPGRCPECGAVMAVPGRADRQPPPLEPDPYRVRRRAHDNHDDHDDDSVRRPRRDVRRDDDDDRIVPADQPPERTFDPTARAAKWQSVSNGLRNLTIATVLVVLDTLVRGGFTLIKGFPQNDADPDAGEIALAIGSLAFFSIALILWAFGRIGFGRVPYLPAQGLAKGASVVAGLTAGAGVLSLVGIGVGIMTLQKNMDMGFGFVMMGGCGLSLALIGFVIAEVMGLSSQIRTATGLRDAAFRRSSKLLMTLFIVLLTGSLIGFCGLFAVIINDTERKQQQQIQQQLPGAGPQGPVRPGKGFNGPNIPPPANLAPANPQPQPQFDANDYPDLMMGMGIAVIAATMLYCLASVVCFQTGRAAVRREIASLVGDPHDHSGSHDPH